MSLEWKSKEGLAVGKGATVQEFVATIGADKLEIDVAPWGEGHLKFNGRQVAHVNDAKTDARLFASSRKLRTATHRSRRSTPTLRGSPP